MELEGFLSKFLAISLPLMAVILLWGTIFSVYSPITVAPSEAAYCAKFTYEDCLNTVPPDPSIECVPMNSRGDRAAKSSEFARCSASFVQGMEPVPFPLPQFLASFVLIVFNLTAIIILCWISREKLKQKLIDIWEMSPKRILRAIAAPLAVILIVRFVSFIWGAFTGSILIEGPVSLLVINSLWQADFAAGIGIGLVFISMYISAGFSVAKTVQEEKDSSRLENAFTGMVGGIIFVLLLDCIVFVVNTVSGQAILEYTVILSYTSIIFPISMAAVGGFLVPKPAFPVPEEAPEAPEGY